MDQLHYDPCDICGVRFYDHEPIRVDLVEIWFPGKILRFLCKACIRKLYTDAKGGTEDDS